MKRLCALLLLLLLSAGGAALAEKDFADIPPALQFTQRMTVERLNNNRVIYVTRPSTARPDVDEALAGVIDGMLAEGRAQLPERGGDNLWSRLDVGPYIHRMGTRWMSFLTISHISHEGAQIWLSVDARTYDMESGRRITLGQVIDPNKDGLAFLSERAREALDGCFGETCDPEALARLTAEDALLDTPFTLSPGHLTLLFRADSLYPGHCQLLPLEVYYPELKPYMTETAIAETDCSAYQLAALTYDDGPARGSTQDLLNQLRIYGADATFFVVGIPLERGPEMAIREQDAGFKVGSHTLLHETDWANLTPENIIPWQAQMDELMTRILGRPPELMRAPGGNDRFYLEAGVQLPLIHWSQISGDASSDPAVHDDPERIAWGVAWVVDGGIVLCHDLNARSARAAESYLFTLRARQVLLLTVPDLCAVRGFELGPGVVLWSTKDNEKYGH